MYCWCLDFILFPCSGQSEVPMLSEHYPGTEPPHAPVAFYPAYDKMPIYVPRGAHPPGPPPLLASKREGPEAHMLPAFYPTPYPPPVRWLFFVTWKEKNPFWGGGGEGVELSVVFDFKTLLLWLLGGQGTCFVCYNVLGRVVQELVNTNQSNKILLGKKVSTAWVLRHLRLFRQPPNKRPKNYLQRTLLQSYKTWNKNSH